jgi:site-specific DNA-methyltransferase (adenine-specific)
MGLKITAKIFEYSIHKHNQVKKIHSTQKPVSLYEFCLINYAKKGDKILDTHLGSGSIAIACHNLGFDLTACELDKEYYNAAMKRLKQHQAQLRII